MLQKFEGESSGVIRYVGIRTQNATVTVWTPCRLSQRCHFASAVLFISLHRFCDFGKNRNRSHRFKSILFDFLRIFPIFPQKSNRHRQKIGEDMEDLPLSYWFRVEQFPFYTQWLLYKWRSIRSLQISRPGGQGEGAEGVWIECSWVPIPHNTKSRFVKSASSFLRQSDPVMCFCL